MRDSQVLPFHLMPSALYQRCDLKMMTVGDRPSAAPAKSPAFEYVDDSKVHFRCVSLGVVYYVEIDGQTPSMHRNGTVLVASDKTGDVATSKLLWIDQVGEARVVQLR